jgi:hypothetical protein
MLKTKNKTGYFFLIFLNYLFAKTKRRCIFATAKKANAFLVSKVPKGIYKKEVFY